MNRGVEDIVTSNSQTSKKKSTSLYEEDEDRVRQIAKSFSLAATGGRPSIDDLSIEGPATVDSSAENDEAVKRALNSRSFYSHDPTLGDSGQVFSS